MASFPPLTAALEADAILRVRAGTLAGSGSSIWLLSLDPSGDCQQHAAFADDTPCGLGILPDGNLIVLTMFRKRLLKYADGQLRLYADLSNIATGTIDDMIVDGLGRCYVGDLGFDLPPLRRFRLRVFDGSGDHFRLLARLPAQPP